MLDSGLSGTSGGTPTFFTNTALDNGTFEGSMSTSLAVGGGRSILLDDGGGMLDRGLSGTNGGTPTFFTNTAEGSMSTSLAVGGTGCRSTLLDGGMSDTSVDGMSDGGMLDSGLSGTNGWTPTFFTNTALDDGTFEGSMSTSLAVGGGRSILLDGGMSDGVGTAVDGMSDSGMLGGVVPVANGGSLDIAFLQSTCMSTTLALDGGTSVLVESTCGMPTSFGGGNSTLFDGSMLAGNITSF